MKELTLSNEENRAVQKCFIKQNNGIATKKDERDSLAAVTQAIMRNAQDQNVMKEREMVFKNLWRNVAQLFPQDKPLSDVPYFAIRQLGSVCVTLVEELKVNLSLEVLEKFENVESLLEHCISEYVGAYNAQQNPIKEVSLEEASAVSTPDEVFRIKEIVLGYIDDAYCNKNKELFDVILTLLNLSDFGIEQIEKALL